MEEMKLEIQLQDGTEEQKQKFEKIQQAITNDADFAAADTLEEAYEALKKYVVMTIEQFKTVYETLKSTIVNTFEEMQAKRQLSDEELDFVAGGGLISWIKKNKKQILEITAFTCAVIAIGGLAGCALAFSGPAGFAWFTVGMNATQLAMTGITAASSAGFVASEIASMFV